MKLRRIKIPKYSSNVLNKFLSLFVLIVILPILIINSFYFPEMTNVMKGYIDNEINLNSKKLTGFLNTEFGNLLAISETLNTQRYLWETNGVKNSSNLMKTSQLLASQLSRSSITEWAFIYNGSYFITASGVVSDKYFLNKVFTLNNCTQEEFIKQMKQTDRPKLLKRGVLSAKYQMNDIQKVSVVPIIIPRNNQQTYYIFFISTEKLDKQIKMLISRNYNYFIENEDSTMQLTDISQEKMSLSNQSYIKRQKGAVYFNLTAYVLYDENIVNGNLYKVQLGNILCIVLLLGIDAAGLAFFINRNYIPAISLFQSINQKEGSKKRGNDFIEALKAVSQLQESNSTLVKKINQYQADSKNTLVYQILSDKINLMNNISDIEEWLKIPLHDHILYAGFIHVRNLTSSTQVSVCAESGQ